MNHNIFTLLLACSLASSAHAQKFISIDNPPYPAAELLPGVEGVTKVQLTVTAEGKPEAATVAESSGFPPLDKAALAAVATAKFAPKLGANGQPVASKAIMPISFQASPSPVDRPCVGLSNELTEFKRFNPDAPVTDFKTAAVLRGALITGLFSMANPTSSMTGRIKGVGAVWDDIVAQCAAQPQANIEGVMKASVKKFNF